MIQPKGARDVVGTLLDLTRDEELDCDQFHEHLAALVDGSGSLDPRLVELMEHHRRICPECEEERAILARALGCD
ncbi:MAG: hypothetical protein AAGF11_26685 [Myxococcota bacterium]